VTLSFGVTHDTSGSASGEISIVTITGSLEKSKNTVHQVKLTFADPEKKPGS
jgi:hypothetical protein